MSGRGAGVAEHGQTRDNWGFMRGTQDPVLKGYVSSNLTPCTMREPRYSNIFAVLWSLRGKGYSESTVRGYGKKLKTLANLVCLDGSEKVRALITAKNDWSIGYRQGLIN